MERFTGGRARGKVGKLGRLHSRAFAMFALLVRRSLGEAGFAAQNRKCIVLQGLTDLGLLAKRSQTFRFVPKLSETFRNFPKLSVSFRPVPPASGAGPMAWRGGLCIDRRRHRS